MSGHRDIVEFDEPNGTHTQYLVIYSTGAVTCDVHEMIDRVYSDAVEPIEENQLSNVMLILNDNESPVWVDVKDLSDGQGLEWQISRPTSESVAEYVLYNDDERTDTHTDDVYVAGFAEEPGYPELEEVEA